MAILARFLISLVMPAWGLAMLILGVVWTSPWWIACGGVVLGVAIVLLVGNPLIEPWLREL